MTVQDTSLEAYETQKPSRVRECYKIILQAISNLQEANDMMIHRTTGLPINVVTPRRGELAKKGHIEVVKRDKCPFTGNSSQFWRIKQ